MKQPVTINEAASPSKPWNSDLLPVTSTARPLSHAVVSASAHVGRRMTPNCSSAARVIYSVPASPQMNRTRIVLRCLKFEALILNQPLLRFLI